MRLLLLGPQGAGKGTQAQRISQEYGIPHIASGELLRAEIAAGTPLGRAVRAIYDRGDLVPDDLVIDIVRNRLLQDDAAGGFVLDGFPRTLQQAAALDEMLADIGHDLTLVLELQVSDEVGRARMLKRASREGRPDDTPEAIDRRLELYHRETEPLVSYYRAQGKLVGIHGDRPVDDVFAEMQQVLEQAVVR